jgi:hypothetical protein
MTTPALTPAAFGDAPDPPFAEPQDFITVQYDVSVRVTAKLTPEQGRQALGLGGTDDESIGTRIQALATHTPSLLMRLAPHETESYAYSWTLQKIDDPWGGF